MLLLIEDYDLAGVEAASAAAVVNPGMECLQKLREASKFLETTAPIAILIEAKRGETKYSGTKLMLALEDAKAVLPSLVFAPNLTEISTHRDLQNYLDQDPNYLPHSPTRLNMSSSVNCCTHSPIDKSSCTLSVGLCRRI